MVVRIQLAVGDPDDGLVLADARERIAPECRRFGPRFVDADGGDARLRVAIRHQKARCGESAENGGVNGTSCGKGKRRFAAAHSYVSSGSGHGGSAMPAWMVLSSSTR